MDATLQAMFQDKNKCKDLFNMCLTHAGDFGKCSLEISRVNVQGRSSQATTVTWSRSQLEQSGRCAPKDINNLIDRCTKEKRYIDDPNFPGVERLRRYCLIDDISQTNQRRQEDHQRISNSGAITASEGTILLGEGVDVKTFHIGVNKFMWVCLKIQFPQCRFVHFMFLFFEVFCQT